MTQEDDMRMSVVSFDPCLISILGATSHAPPRKVTSEELEEKLGLRAGHIFKRTRIDYRYIATTETTESLAVAAGKKVLQNTGLTPGAIGVLIVATFTPSMFLPGIASKIAYSLDLENCNWTSDTNTACTSGVAALLQAASFLAHSDAEYALVIASDTATKFVNWQDPGGVTPLLGDAAVAVVLAKNGKGLPIRMFATTTEPKLHDAIQLDVQGEGGKTYIRIRGRDVFKFAVDTVPPFARGMLARAEMSVDDVDLFIMHQANGRIIETIQKKLKIPSSRLFSNISQYGNTSSAATLLPFAIAMERGLSTPEMVTTLVSFGAGMTLTGVVIGKK